jgi:hypothetical protein
MKKNIEKFRINFINLFNKIVLVFFITNFANNGIFAQNNPIQIDRPDQTECPFIVPEQYLQFESGFLLENENKETKNIEVPSLLWKYGFTKKLELRMITEFISNDNFRKKSFGLMPLTIGFKVHICEEKGIMPMVSFIGHLTTAMFASKKFQQQFSAPSFRFTLQNTVTKKITIGYNLGMEWNGKNALPTYIYTLTTGISLTEKISGYIEMYGFASNKLNADNRLDGGITYLINNDLIIDLSGGFGLSQVSPKNYIAFGISYRYKSKK